MIVAMDCRGMGVSGCEEEVGRGKGRTNGEHHESIAVE